MSTFRELMSFLSEDFAEPKVCVKSVVYIALFSLVPRNNGSINFFLV